MMIILKKITVVVNSIFVKFILSVTYLFAIGFGWGTLNISTLFSKKRNKSESYWIIGTDRKVDFSSPY